MPLGSRLPPFFKTFDYFDRETGLAASAKTINTTTASRLANPEQIYYTLKGYVDAAVEFPGYTVGKVRVSAGQVSSKAIELAVPQGTTSAGWAQIAQAMDYALNNGVTLLVNVAK